MRPLPILLFLAIPWLARAQHTVQGRVVDERTLEPLAFVHVVPSGGRDGTTTDIDGRFTLPVPARSVTLRFSYVGYQPAEAVATAGVPVLVHMRRGSFELRPVEVFPGDNPAHRIIKRVHANRKANDGLRNRAHRYTSYSKTVFTADLDSAVLNDPVRLAALDSGDQRAIDFLEKQHLLLVESATRKSFTPPAAEKEEVIALRVSGLKDPSLLALVASTKTISMYDPHVELGEKTFLGPIGPGSTERYLFILEDTLYQGPDTVFIISYAPRSGRNFDGLKGVLWVNTDGYALQNAIAEPVERTGNFSVKVQQQFAKVGGTAWFPVQLNTFLYVEVVRVNSWKVTGIGRTYLKDIRIDEPIPRREVRGPELVMERGAIRRDEAFWAALRTDTLSERELRTYHAIDSISEAGQLERKLKWLGALASGRFRAGPFDLPLARVMDYNGYEGLRLGLGAVTNRTFSRHVRLGGWFAHGFRDRAWKYGGDITLRPWPGRSLAIKGMYSQDVEESGGVAFHGIRPGLLSPEGYRTLFIDRMDRVERAGAEVAFRVGSALRLWLGTGGAVHQNLIGYQYARPLGEEVSLLTDRFRTGHVSLGLRFAFREQVARLPDFQFGLGTRWPVLYLNAYHAREGLWGGELDLWRVHAMVEKTFRLRMLGELSVRAMVGIADPLAPYPFLFNPRGTFSRDLPLAARYTFETMRPNEFLADRYVALHLRHSFGNLLFKGKKSSPVPVLVANAGLGALTAPERHRGYSFATMADGYLEAGAHLENVVRARFLSLGIGAYYRMGPQTLPDPLDNLAVKLVLGFSGL